MISDRQREVAQTPGNVLVSACPGSGKTHTLVARANWRLSSLPEHKKLALITYTNAAADEIASRIERRSDVFIGTIHRFCLEFVLRPFSWTCGWNNPRILSHEQKLDFISRYRGGYDLGRNPVEELNNVRRNMDGELDLSVEWRMPANLESIARLYYQFMDELGVIDFNEVLYRSYRIVNEHRFVGRSMANVFYEIMIDEFQDTNALQYELFCVVGKLGSVTFFLVGDDRQAIMSFAGAMQNPFPQASLDFTTTSKELLETFRSTDNIVRAYSSIVPNHPTIFNSSDHAGLDIPVEVIYCGSNYCIGRCSNCTSDIECIRECVQWLTDDRGVQLEDIAILSPWWTDCYKVSRHLRGQYPIVGLGALPHTSRDIKDSTFAVLQALARYRARHSIRCLRSVRRNAELHCIENRLDLGDYFTGSVNQLISKFLALDGQTTLREAITVVRGMMDEAFPFQHATLNVILRRITENDADDWPVERYFKTLADAGGLQNMTFHGSKGLEFKAVILNHVDEGKIPFGGHRALPRDVENGRKLLYVGLSRAEQYLFVMHGCEQSRFVEMLAA